MRKLTRREMLKSISIGLAGAVFAVPGVLKAEDQKNAEDDAPVVARAFYDVFTKLESLETSETFNCKGALTKSHESRREWVIPAPKAGWKILPSSFKTTYEIINEGNCLDKEVGKPVFQKDGSVMILLRIKARRRESVTLIARVKYDIAPVADSEFDLKTGAVEFEDGKATLKLPDAEKGKIVQTSSVEVTRSSGKKENINISNVDGEYVVQNGLLIKISEDKKTFTIKRK